MERIRTELSQAEYFQKTTTLSFSVIDEGEEFAIGTARHRFLRISGMKFSEEFGDAEYVFRKEGGAWKLWTTRTVDRERPTINEGHRAGVFEDDEYKEIDQ